MLNIIVSVLSNLELIAIVFILIDLVDNSRWTAEKNAAMAVTAVNTYILSEVIVKYMDYLSAVFYLLMMAAACMIAYRKFRFRYLYIIAVAELCTEIISSNITAVLNHFHSENYTLINALAILSVRAITLAALLIAGRNRKFSIVSRIYTQIPKYIYALIFVSLLSVAALSTVNNHPAENIQLKRICISVITFIIIVSFIFIIVSLLFTVFTDMNYSQNNSLLRKQVAVQISHYEKLDRLNSDIRRFRHDYINHLNSINTLIENESYSDAQRYIERLTESNRRHEAVFNTGSRLADAILTDKSDSCKDFADISFDGFVSDKIENTDMCIILANALDNAVEACRKCTDRSRISITAQVTQGYWTMKMSNPTIGEDADGAMKTTKEDVQNHGFGLISIEHAVKRYDGSMNVSIKDRIFELKIVMKLEQ